MNSVWRPFKFLPLLSGAAALTIGVVAFLEPVWVKKPLYRPHVLTSAPVLFSVATTTYAIPGTYMVVVPSRGYDVGAELRVAYPGFGPLSHNTRECPNPAQLSENMKCFPVEVFITRKHETNINADHQTNATTAEGFERSKASFRNQRPDRGPAGFEKYHIGPYDGGSNMYRKLTPNGALVLDCIEFPSYGRPEGICSDSFDFSVNTVIDFHINESQIGYSEKIKDGLVALLTSFIVDRNNRT